MPTPNQPSSLLTTTTSHRNRDSRRWSLVSINSTSSSSYGGINTPPALSSLPPSFQQQTYSSNLPTCSSASNILSSDTNCNPNLFYSSNEKIVNKSLQKSNRNLKKKRRMLVTCLVYH